MESRTVLPSAVVLILRLLTLGLLAASLVLIATDKLNIDGSDDSSSSENYTDAGDSDSSSSVKYTFRDIHAYRYVLAVAVIGCAYTLLQLPFAAVSIARGKSANGGGGSVAAALVLVIADVVLVLLLATGAAAGFGFTSDVKRILDGLFDDTYGIDQTQVKMDRFFDLASASAGLMLATAVSMALVVMLSVYSLAK